MFRVTRLATQLWRSSADNVFSKGYSTGPGRGPVGDQNARRMQSTVYYFGATAVLTLGLSYAAVPLYRMFCQATSYGGTTSAQHDGSKVEDMQTRTERRFKIKFNADTGASMRWNFKPQQQEIRVSAWAEGDPLKQLTVCPSRFTQEKRRWRSTPQRIRRTSR